MYVDCTSYTHNINDSSENISQSIHFLVMPNERAIVMDVLVVQEHSFTVDNIEVCEVKSDKTVFVQ
jgi:hypothetical protein